MVFGPVVFARFSKSNNCVVPNLDAEFGRDLNLPTSFAAIDKPELIYSDCATVIKCTKELIKLNAAERNLLLRDPFSESSTARLSSLFTDTHNHFDLVRALVLATPHGTLEQSFPRVLKDHTKREARQIRSQQKLILTGQLAYGARLAVSLRDHYLLDPHSLWQKTASEIWIEYCQAAFGKDFHTAESNNYSRLTRVAVTTGILQLIQSRDFFKAITDRIILKDPSEGPQVGDNEIVSQMLGFKAKGRTLVEILPNAIVSFLEPTDMMRLFEIRRQRDLSVDGAVLGTYRIPQLADRLVTVNRSKMRDKQIAAVSRPRFSRSKALRLSALKEVYYHELSHVYFGNFFRRTVRYEPFVFIKYLERAAAKGKNSQSSEYRKVAGYAAEWVIDAAHDEFIAYANEKYDFSMQPFTRLRTPLITHFLLTVDAWLWKQKISTQRKQKIYQIFKERFQIAASKISEQQYAAEQNASTVMDQVSHKELLLGKMLISNPLRVKRLHNITRDLLKEGLRSEQAMQAEIIQDIGDYLSKIKKMPSNTWIDYLENVQFKYISDRELLVERAFIDGINNFISQIGEKQFGRKYFLKTFREKVTLPVLVRTYGTYPPPSYSTLQKLLKLAVLDYSRRSIYEIISTFLISTPDYYTRQELRSLRRDLREQYPRTLSGEYLKKLWRSLDSLLGSIIHHEEGRFRHNCPGRFLKKQGLVTLTPTSSAAELARSVDLLPRYSSRAWNFYLPTSVLSELTDRVDNATVIKILEKAPKLDYLLWANQVLFSRINSLSRAERAQLHEVLSDYAPLAGRWRRDVREAYELLLEKSTAR